MFFKFCHTVWVWSTQYESDVDFELRIAQWIKHMAQVRCM
jgi:hypothetical protein